MSRTTANLLLLVAALIWGTTFVAQQLGMANVGPLTYTGIRFLIGALFILPLAWREQVRMGERGLHLDRRDLIGGAGLGVLLFCGAIFQQIGLMTTTVTNAGFLTALYVPLVPLLAWAIHHQRPHASALPMALACLAGTYLLGGGRLDNFAAGDFWVLLSALFWAGHVLWVGRVAAAKGAAVRVACGQFLICGILSTLLAPWLETITVAGLITALPAILYGGLLSVGVGFTIQVMAQRHTHAADAAILLSSETLFAALAGWLYLGERLSAMQLAGCGLILASILAVQLLPLWMERKMAAA